MISVSCRFLKILLLPNYGYHCSCFPAQPLLLSLNLGTNFMPSSNYTNPTNPANIPPPIRRNGEVPSSIMYFAVHKTLQRMWRVHADAWVKITGDSNARSSKRPTLSWILTYLNTLQANYQSPCQTQKKHKKKQREVLLIIAYKLQTQQVGNKNFKKCFTCRKTCEDTKTGHKSGLH